MRGTEIIFLLNIYCKHLGLIEKNRHGGLGLVIACWWDYWKLRDPFKIHYMLATFGRNNCLWTINSRFYQPRMRFFRWVLGHSKGDPPTTSAVSTDCHSTMVHRMEDTKWIIAVLAEKTTPNHTWYCWPSSSQQPIQVYCFRNESTTLGKVICHTKQFRR